MGAPKDVTVLSFAIFFQFIVSFFISIFLARFLGPNDYGIYRVILSIAGIFVVFSQFISPLTLMHFTSKENKKKVFWVFFAITFTLTFFLFLLIVFLSNSISHYYNISKRYVLFAALELFFLSFYGIIDYLKGLGKFTSVAISLIFFNIIRIISIPSAIIYGLFGVLYWRILSWGLFYLFSFFIFLKGVIGKFNFDLSLSKRIFTYNFPLFVSSFPSSFILYFIIAYLGKISSSQAAYFSIALMLVSIFSMFVNPIFQVSISKNIKEKNFLELIKKVTKYSTYFGGFVFVAFLAFGKEIIFLLLSKKYVGAILSLYILAFSTYISSSFMGFNVFLLKSNRTKEHAVLMTTTPFIFLIFALYLIPIYASLGAAIAFLVSRVFFIVFANALIEKHKIQIGRTHILISLVAGIVSIIPSKLLSFYLSTFFSILLIPLFSFALYVFSMYSLKGFDEYDRTLVKKLIRNVRLLVRL